MLKPNAIPPSTAELAAPVHLLWARWTEAAAVAVAVIGLLVLVGWSGDIELMKRGDPDAVPMNPVTAASFILGGLALWLLRRPGAPIHVRGLAQSVGALLCLVGLVKLLWVAGLTDFSVDVLLFRERMYAEPDGLSSGMSVLTAVAIVFYGLSLLWLGADTAEGDTVAQIAALIGGCIGLFVALGYAYGTYAAFGLGRYQPLALHTVGSLVLLGGAILSSRPRGPLVRALTAPDHGGRMARRLLPTVVIAPVLLGLFRILGERAGFYDAQTGVALTAISAIIVSSAAVWLSARAISRAEQARRAAERTLHNAYAALEQTASVDALTGVANRGGLQKRLTEECARCARYPDYSFSIAMLDVDRFKEYNDSFGHVAGDDVLKQVAQALNGAARETDLVGRYGGEEFLLILSHTGAAGARRLGERLREAIEQEDWPNRAITVSVGTATTSRGIHDVTGLLRAADEALYAAKDAGRNRAFHIDDLTAVTLSA